MRICVYCGKSYSNVADLCKHMRKKYAGRNLTVIFETQGKWSSPTPSWILIHHIGAPIISSRAQTTSGETGT
ncbi:hypothetical protein BGZ63DRAFT_391168 [Mariannaea sp. PMI_226]|nr:hypothetical protein BGZ63DRAFT_391168 [Mariannaea sp. PMI_226]